MPPVIDACVTGDGAGKLSVPGTGEPGGRGTAGAAPPSAPTPDVRSSLLSPPKGRSIGFGAPATAPKVAGRCCPATQLSNCWGVTVNARNRILACDSPQ